MSVMYVYFVADVKDAAAFVFVRVCLFEFFLMCFSENAFLGTFLCMYAVR